MSAGTLSPVVSITKSPGTKYFASNISSLPSLNNNDNDNDIDNNNDNDNNDNDNDNNINNNNMEYQQQK